KSPPLTRQDPGRAPDGGAHFLYRTIAKEKFSADYCKVYVKFRGGAAKKHPAGSPARSRYPVGMGKIKIRGSILTIPQSRPGCKQNLRAVWFFVEKPVHLQVFSLEICER